MFARAMEATSVRVPKSIGWDADVWAYIERRAKVERLSRSAFMNRLVAEEMKRHPVPEEDQPKNRPARGGR